MSGESAARRAEEAERAVRERFGGRLLGLPGTHLARIWAPATAQVPAFTVPVKGVWHYWWQAHYLDALVDAGRRWMRGGDNRAAASRARLGHRVLATMRLRNGGSFANHFFDDMAWLALAVGRLAALDEQLGRRAARASLRHLQRFLAGELSKGIRPGGGVFWNRDRRFLNSATTAPVALAAARAGHRDLARRQLDWLGAHLIDEATGLVIDGVHPGEEGDELVETAFTYNQGTALALLLELGELEAASSLVTAIAEHLTVEANGRRVLLPNAGGDGGLFAGILARHLGFAARHPELTPAARDLARDLVNQTADALWDGFDGGIFPDDLARPAEPRERVELSGQVTAWMSLEAAARLE